MSRLMTLPRSATVSLMVMLIRGYRLFISPWLANSCRFEPSCSQFAITAIEQHGPIKGGWMTIQRLGRCHPGHPGGYDPVPED